MIKALMEAFQRLTGHTPRAFAFDPDTGDLLAEITFEVAIFEDELDGGFVATCVNLPGAASQGETVEEALENLGDAIGGIVAANFERHLPAKGEIMSGSPNHLSVPVSLLAQRDQVPA